MENLEEGNQHSGAPPPVEGVGGGGTSYGWSDGGCQLHASISGVIDPSKIPSADLVHVWHMPSTENVGNQGIPQQFEHISLLAARNEKESVQISLRQKVSWGGSGTVRIQCSDLCSPSGDRMVVGQSLTLRQVLPVLGVPDALAPLDLPVSQINLLPGETSSVWLSVDVPIDQPCGQYEGEICITAITSDTESSGKSLAKSEKYKLHQEINDCLDVFQTLQDKPHEEVVERLKVATSTLRRVLMSPTFSEFIVCPEDLMDEDVHTNISIQMKLLVTVWDFTIPQTPSLPAVFGISETVIEDRFCLKHGSPDWYDALERHFNWLLQYRISPFFCRWGDSMRIFAYTCPWPADHPKSDEYYSNPRLAAYAVPCVPSLLSNETAKNYFKKEMDILRSKSHWKKAYFYLWDEPLNADHFRSINDLSSELKSYAPDARVLTTYYRGPRNTSDSQSSFEAFVKVPNYLRPHTQIFCTSEWVLGNRDDLVKDIVSELQPEKGEEWWTYVCMGPPDPQPNWHLGMSGTQHRAVMWRVWKEGGTGFLYWGSNCYEKAMVPSAEVKFRRGLPPGDGVLFYPGEVFSSSHDPVASVRLERALSGLQDIEYLNLYSSRYGREEALALLEKTGIYLGPERYTRDHRSIDAMRAEIYRTCGP